MSNTVKLIIEIPKAEYERLVYIDHLKLRGYIENGIPLDSVIAKMRAEQEKYSHPLEIEHAIEILDNIGKAESEGK